jgi:flagellar hook-basal body complex protein FliE
MEVPRIGPQSPQPLPGPSGQEPEELSFKELIGRYVREVNDLQQEADQSVLELATGKTDNLHQVVAALSEADLSFRLMMEIRNKLLEAYQQIMRMQV